MRQYESTFEVRGVKLRTFRSGRGEPVLFLHGAAGLNGWTPFFESLSRHHDLIAIEHPGYGQSDDPTWIGDMSALAAFYVDVVDQLGVGRVHLVGSSLGGWLASEVSVRNSSRIRSLTLVAPAGLRTDDIPVPDMLAWTPAELTRQVYFNPAIAEQLLAQELTAEQKQTLAKNRATTAKLGRTVRFSNPSLAAQLNALELPCLLLWGDTDRVTPTAYAGYWKKQLRHAQLEILTECGHLPHFEKPDLAADRIRAFLQAQAR